MDFIAVMSDEELTVHEINIGFDAAESMIERIQERARVLIIIMRMGAGQRDSGLGGGEVLASLRESCWWESVGQEDEEGEFHEAKRIAEWIDAE